MNLNYTKYESNKKNNKFHLNSDSNTNVDVNSVYLL